MKYKRSTTLGFKDIEITKNQSLCRRLNSFFLFRLENNRIKNLAFFNLRKKDNNNKTLQLTCFLRFGSKGSAFRICNNKIWTWTFSQFGPVIWPAIANTHTYIFHFLISHFLLKKNYTKHNVSRLSWRSSVVLWRTIYVHVHKYIYLSEGVSNKDKITYL